ncbi:glycosyltransferase [bacterium]|nr:glycosyltransferase [bacterium]
MTPRTLALGVVTYESSPAVLSHLHLSLVNASTRLPESVSLVVHVIDNGAPSEWPGEVVRHPSSGNVGFARAANVLLDAAFKDPRCEAFVCVNPDGVLHANALRELHATWEKRPGSLVEARQFPEEHPKPYDPLTLETPWASGACLLVPRVVHEKIGGFDPGFFLYAEDVDYSWRARRAGFSVLTAPGAIFAHKVLSRASAPLAERHHLLSARRLARKWGSAAFEEWAEGELLRRGFFSSRGELPALDEADRVREDGAGVADFEHALTFARARW